MSSKALDEIIKFTFTRSTHYYRVEDLLIDNQKNIFASAFCIRIRLPALASVENWQSDLSVETARLVISLACPRHFYFWITRPSGLKTTIWLKEIIKTRQWGSDTLNSTWQEPSESAVTWSYRKTLQTLYKTKQWKILKISPSMSRLIKEKVFNLFQVGFSLALLWLV